jgi:hypothetical protein
MQTGLQIAFAIQFAIFGLAHLLRPEPLIQFFGVLRTKGESGVVFMALLGVITGSLLVAFHNVWSGIPIVLTIFGWAQLLKGTAYLLFPSFGLRQFERVTPERTTLFRLPGIVLLVMAALLAWHLVTTHRE